MINYLYRRTVLYFNIAFSISKYLMLPIMNFQVNCNWYHYKSSKEILQICITV